MKLLYLFDKYKKYIRIPAGSFYTDATTLPENCHLCLLFKGRSTGKSG